MQLLYSLTRMHLLRWFLLFAVVALAAGCTGWAEGPYNGRGAVSGEAKVQIDGYKFPIADAGVVLTYSYPYRSVTKTDRSGRYTYRGLQEGRHKFTLQALHGTYDETVHVRPDERRQPQRLDWNVRPPHWLNSELFFYLSGLKSLYIVGPDRFDVRYGELVRWEKSIVRVHFDEYGVPPQFRPRWIAKYKDELRNWESYVGGRISFVLTNDPNSADIVVMWVPEGSLYDRGGEHVGIARQYIDYENGALKRVEIEIDVAYGDYPGLWEHELAHAMGVDHLRDENSVMHPYIYRGQRTTLSKREVDHVRLMYDIPSGVRLSPRGGYGVFGMLAGDVDGGGDIDGESVEVETEPVSGRREHVLLLDPELWL